MGGIFLVLLHKECSGLCPDPKELPLCLRTGVAGRRHYWIWGIPLNEAGRRIGWAAVSVMRWRELRYFFQEKKEMSASLDISCSSPRISVPQWWGFDLLFFQKPSGKENPFTLASATVRPAIPFLGPEFYRVIRE